jgi:hypothetical protein
MHRRPTARRPLLLELLEDRSLPAASAVSAALNSGVLTVTGTPGDDTITVRRSNNVITVDGTGVALPAAVVSQLVVNAGAGNDVISVNSQDTAGYQQLGVAVVVSGGDGNDTILGTPGADRLYGQNGNDKIAGGAGDDVISGGNGNDWIDGSIGNDFLTGDYGNDSLIGGVGADMLYGGADNDSLSGGAGNDFLIGAAGRDNFDGGDGVDRYQDDYARPDPAAGPAGVLRAIAAGRPGETHAASPEDIRQQVANTCSLLSSLAAFARTSPTDLAARVGYDAAGDKYLVPLDVNNTWTNVPVAFNGVWSDNDPYPLAAADGTSRDYWPLLYQRAYLQALNVDTSNTDSTQWAVRGTRPDQVFLQNWRYPDVALHAVTGAPTVVRYGLSATDKQLLEDALHAGKDVIANTQTWDSQRSAVDGTGLIFSHTYAVVNVADDAQGTYVDLRNPWGVDTRPEYLTSMAPAARSALTLGNANDGAVRVRWDTFGRAFATYVIA